MEKLQEIMKYNRGVGGTNIKFKCLFTTGQLSYLLVKLFTVHCAPVAMRITLLDPDRFIQKSTQKYTQILSQK